MRFCNVSCLCALPLIRFEYALARQCGELHRALQCLLALCWPSSQQGPQENEAPHYDADIDAMDSTGILTIAASQAK